jgi:ACDE family multidrug resistance protein
MAIGFIAIAMFLPRTPPPPREARVSVLEPLRALRHRATRGSGLTAVFYNFGFFTLLAYTPFPLHLGIHQLGYTFTAWGLLLALSAVFVAPWLSRRFNDVHGLAGALLGIVVVLAVMGVTHASQTALIICVICSGAFFGITNTLMTQVVMESAPVARPIASSAYSVVRFCGGAIAPFVAGKLGEHVNVQAPFYLGAAMTTVAIGVLWSYRTALSPVPDPATPAPAEHGTLVIAVGGPSAREVCAICVPLARARATPVHVLHVVERDVVTGEDAIDIESSGDARELLDGCVAELRDAGVPVVGELLHSVGTHADVATRILERAAQLSATTIVLGPETRHGRFGARINARVAGSAPTHVLILNPAAGPLRRPNAPAQLWRTLETDPQGIAA